VADVDDGSMISSFVINVKRYVAVIAGGRANATLAAGVIGCRSKAK
jgi:hypothetical protein